VLLYVALGVVAIGVLVLVVRALGRGGAAAQRLPPADLGLRSDPFGTARPVTPPPRSSPFDPPKRGSPFDPPFDPSSVPAPDDALRAEIAAVLARGDKIGAIKLYRERTGASLLEAKNQVEAWALRGAALPAAPLPEAPRRVPLPPIESRPALLAECDALARTNKISAIKRWPEATHAPLHAAKTLVEALVELGAAGIPGDVVLAAWPETEPARELPAEEPSAFPPARPNFEPEPIGERERAALLEECVAIARGGDKIGAIKKYRERTGMGLRDAKDTIERALGEPA